MPNRQLTENLRALAAPGQRADQAARRLLSQGKVVSRQLTAGAYVGVVEIRNRFGRLVHVPDVQFNVPIAVGDVVSLELINGGAGGVYGSPVRPKGPNVLAFRGPRSVGEWFIDQSAPAEARPVDAAFNAYVFPFLADVAADQHYPSGIASNVLLTLPERFVLQNPQTAVGVDFSYLAVGAVRFSDGSVRPLRCQHALLELAVLDEHLIRPIDLGDPVYVNVDLAGTESGVDTTAPTTVTHGGQTFGSAAYFFRSINPGGHRYLFAGADMSPYVGQGLRVQVKTPSAVGLRPFTRIGTEYFTIGGSWERLFGNTALGPFTFWMGFRDLTLTLVEIGTGSA